MFSIISYFLDKTRVSFKEKDGRFSELKSFYDKSLSHLGLSFLLILFVIAAGVLIWRKGLNPTPADFFVIPNQDKAQSDQSGRIQVTELPTSLNPRMSTLRVQKWVSRSLVDLYDLNFLDYNEQIKRGRLIMRQDTYESFLLSMNAKKRLGNEIVNKKLSTSLTPTSEVQVIAQDKLDSGRRVWKMHMTGLLVRSGALAGGAATNDLIFELIVEEVPTPENPFGLSIANLRISDYAR